MFSRNRNKIKLNHILLAILPGLLVAGFWGFASSNPKTIFDDSLPGAMVIDANDTQKRTIIATDSLWQCGDTLIDSRDSQAYATVQIGSQCWMKQSMNVGTQIAGTSNQGTSCTSIQKYCYLNTGSNCTSNNPNYPDGALYQWHQAMCGSTAAGAQGICPTGWHIPTDPEFKTLVESQATAGCESSTDWQCSPAGTNLKPNGTSGFEGNLAGTRNTSGSFGSRGSSVWFWSSTQYDSTYSWYRRLDSAQTGVFRHFGYDESRGRSVRCLKD